MCWGKVGWGRSKAPCGSVSIRVPFEELISKVEWPIHSIKVGADGLAATRKKFSWTTSNSWQKLNPSLGPTRNRISAANAVLKNVLAIPIAYFGCRFWVWGFQLKTRNPKLKTR